MKCKVEQEKERFMDELKLWNKDPAKNAVSEAVQKGARGSDGGGAIYAPGTSAVIRGRFRDAWQRNLLSAGKQYKEVVSEKDHTEQLKSMCQSLTDEHKNILANGSMRIGVVQKGLNLYLKTLWCAKKIQYPPPHCTLDDEILNKARKALGSDAKTTRPWSRLDRVEDYEICIEQCKKAAKKHRCIQCYLDNDCIQESQIAAVWELFVWNDLCL